MDTVQAVCLALLQGLTEFLPISSSAHLILMPVLFGWPDQGLAFDVAVHVGTLIAVILYFRADLIVMFTDWLRSMSGKGNTEASRLVWYVILGTLPVGLAGLALNDSLAAAIRSPLTIATTTIVFGLVLWWAEKTASERRGTGQMSWKDAVIVGVFQALALIPGTSRSGITITAGLFLGLKRKSAARFSFLLSIPVIALAGLVKTRDLLESPNEVPWSAIGVGVCLSGVTAYLTIGWFLRLLDRVGLMPFVIYRLCLGALLFAVFLRAG